MGLGTAAGASASRSIVSANAVALVVRTAPTLPLAQRFSRRAFDATLAPPTPSLRVTLTLLLILPLLRRSARFLRVTAILSVTLPLAGVVKDFFATFRKTARPLSP